MTRSKSQRWRLHRGGLRKAMRSVGAGWAWIALSACGAHTASQPTNGASAAGQLAMRDPGDLRSPLDARPLGTLEPAVAPSGAERPAKSKVETRAGARERNDVETRAGARERNDVETRAGARERNGVQVRAELPPIRVAPTAKLHPYALRDGELVLPGGLTVHRVPRGVSARIVEEQGTSGHVWEIVDARGRRLALIEEKSWRRAAASEAPVLDETTTIRREARRTDWGPTPMRVVVDRFRGDTHIYTLERRASGTDWIWSGLELVNRSTHPNRAH